jgi:anti-anti-sigma factor
LCSIYNNEQYFIAPSITFFVVGTAFKMPTRTFSISQDGQGIYHLEGELSIHELDKFKAFLEESLKGAREVPVSLAKVRFIDTAALQLLIAFKRRVEPDEAKLKISAVSAEVEDILSLCGLKAALL